MNICIVGWYGTETLGDRAILDGILAIFNELAGEYTCYLGSLYPFFTERTLHEDGLIYKKTAPGCEIKIFDEKSKEDTRQAVMNSDYVIMGGGPVMELSEMKLIIRAFKMAKRAGKQTVLMGCGLGPLHTPEYYQLAAKLICLSDKVIWRDELSADFCREISGRSDIYVMDDPAIISAQKYKVNKVQDKRTEVAINFRAFPQEYGNNKGLTMDKIRELLITLSELYEVHLIPMHTFFIGGDDRHFFAEICNEELRKKISVQYIPQNLYQLYETYMNATACIGMRYHSVVLQTILNGNNYILDYTNPKVGKIRGFLQHKNLEEFYADRYFNMQCEEEFDVAKCVTQISQNKNYEYDIADCSLKKYCEILGK